MPPSGLPADRIAEGHAAGRSCRSLARAFGASPETVSRLLRTLGRAMPPPGAALPLPAGEIALRYAAGEPTGALAKEFGVSRDTILKRVLEGGARVRARPGDPGRLPLPDAEIARRYAAGESSTRLAREFGTSEATVLRRVRERGQPVRRRAGRPPLPQPPCAHAARRRARAGERPNGPPPGAHPGAHGTNAPAPRAQAPHGAALRPHPGPIQNKGRRGLK